MHDHILNPANLVFMVPIISTVAFFTYLAIATWPKSRLRERQAFYKNETIQRIAASPDGAASVLEYLREEKQQAAKMRQEKIRLGGLITVAAGLGLMIFLEAILHAEHVPDPVYLLGLIPLLIGAAMLAYSYWLAPKE